jgi:hypothetical protein
MRFARTFVAIAAALSLIMLACDDDGGGGDGGSDTASLEEYFAAVQGADDTFAAGTNDLDTQFQGLADEQVSEAADLLEQQVDVLEMFADDLDAIDAPDEVAEVHDAAVESLRTYADDFGSALDTFSEAATITEGFETFADVDTSSLEAAQGNCIELEEIAANNDIDVSLSCGSGEFS